MIETVVEILIGWVITFLLTMLIGSLILRHERKVIFGDKRKKPRR